MDVELLADHVDHAQRDLAQFPTHRTERAAQAQGVDAQPHEFARAGILHRRVDAFAAGRRAYRFDRIVPTAVDDDIGAPALEGCGLAGVACGGDDGGAGELGKGDGGRAHTARRAGNENVVVHPHVKSVGDDAVGGGARPHGGGALIEVEIGPHFDPVALRARHELRVAAEHGVAGEIDSAGEIAQPADACERERVFGIGHAEHAVAGRERRHACAHRRDFAGDVATELHRHRESAAAVNAAVMSGGFAVELVHLAGAVLDVPARDGGGEHLNQNIGRGDLRHRMVAVAELVGPAELEQPDRFHRGHGSPAFASASQRMNRLKSAFLARSPICLCT